MIKPSLSLFVCGCLLVLGGCSPYVDDFHYVPHPAVSEIRAATSQPTTQPFPQPAMQPMGQPATPPAVVAYATIVGVRREDQDKHIPLSVEVRLQLDNMGGQPVSFDPNSLDLTTAEMVRFLQPIVTPPQAVSVPPDRPVMVDAFFPFPPGLSYTNVDLRSLQLRWAVEIEGRPVMQHADFRRAYHAYYDPYYDYQPYGYPYGYPYYYGPRFGVGGVVIIRR